MCDAKPQYAASCCIFVAMCVCKVTASLLVVFSSLGKLSEELVAKSAGVAKKRKDAEFLSQKTRQYRKLADDMKVSLRKGDFSSSGCRTERDGMADCHVLLKFVIQSCITVTVICMHF